MGTWGTAISSNDTYSDVYTDFMDHYDDGEDVEKITKRLIVKNQEMIADRNDAHNFWFALAKAQWMCGKLDKVVLSKVHAIVKSGDDISIWQELGLSKTDLKKRQASLLEFVQSLSKPREKVRLRKKSVIRQPRYEKGVCLSYRIDNGLYTGAIVLEAEHDTEYGFNLVAITNMRSKAKPTIKDYLHTRVPSAPSGILPRSPQLQWVSKVPSSPKNLEIVGKINVKRHYESSRLKYGFCTWKFILDALEYQSTAPSIKRMLLSKRVRYFL